MPDPGTPDPGTPDPGTRGHGTPDPLVARLRAVGCVFAEEEAAEIRRVLTSDEAAADSIVEARGRGIPLEHALGRAVFAGAEVEIGERVFVPRARAEVLVDAAVEARPDARVVVDLGCGSGAIAAALAARLPGAEIHAADLDREALVYARRNGERYGFAVHEGDWWNALPVTLHGRIDLAVAYLPHVPTGRLDEIPDDYRRHEPGIAVAGGPDGLEPLRTVAAGMERWLAPRGVLVTAIAGEQQEAARIVAGTHAILLVTV